VAKKKAVVESEPIKAGRGGARPGAGRKKKEKSEQLPQVQFGRRSQDDIDLIDKAASIEGETRAGWVWPILIREAKKTIRKAGAE
jgi:hypothetical protein